MRRQLNKGQVVGNNKETIQSLMQKLQEMSPLIALTKNVI